MKSKAINSKKNYNRFWENPKAIIGFFIVVAGSSFSCGIYYNKIETYKEILKIHNDNYNTISEKDRIINELNNKHTLDACKYENEITLLKQK